MSSERFSSCLESQSFTGKYENPKNFLVLIGQALVKSELFSERFVVACEMARNITMSVRREQEKFGEFDFVLSWKILFSSGR